MDPRSWIHGMRDPGSWGQILDPGSWILSTLGGALKYFYFLFQKFCNFAVHGSWEHLVAWKMVPGDLAVICLQFCEILKNQSKSRCANNSRKCLDLDPIRRTHFFWPARAPPSCSFSVEITAISNIVQQIQYLTICFISEFQENTCA